METIMELLMPNRSAETTPVTWAQVLDLCMKVFAITFIIGFFQVCYGQEIRQATLPAEQPRVGIDARQSLKLSLQEAVKMALENNRDIEVERGTVRLNDFKRRAAEGAYDGQVDGSVAYDNQTIPVAAFFAGGDQGKLKMSDLAASATFTQRLPRQGGTLEATFESRRLASENLFQSLNPQYFAGLSVTITQPLFRNRKIDAPRRDLLVAKKRLDLSDSEFRQRVVEIIAQVQRLYWELVYARRDLDIKRESVELAKAQLESNQHKVEKGTLAPLDVVSARVELERRTDEEQAAVEGLHRAENALKTMLMQNNSDEVWRSAIEPIEQPQIDMDSLMPFDEALAVAFKNRPELEQYRLREEMNKTDVAYFANQTRPQVDFFAGYRATGFAGKERTSLNPFLSSNELLLARVNQLSQTAGLPILATAPVGTLSSSLVGNYGQSFANLFRNDYRSFRVGVSFTFSVGNRTAKANLGHALAEGKQIEAKRQQTQQAIEAEVRNALQAVEISRRRFEAARNSRVDAELQNQGEQRKFEAGLSTNFLVLDRQNALSAARGRELKALTDANKAMVELQRALSTTLTHNHISIASVR